MTLGVSEPQMDKSADDIEYYDDEKDNSDESHRPGDDEEDLDMDWNFAIYLILIIK